MTMDDTKYQSLMKIGESAAASIVEMVAALECDYDRLEELREAHEANGKMIDDVFTTDDAQELLELTKAAGECTSREEAEQRIQEDALSVEVRSGWNTLETIAHHGMVAEEFNILLTTGGPAVRIIGELDGGEVSRPRLEVQDWGTPWTEYRQIERATLEAYCGCFYFGELIATQSALFLNA